MSDKDCAKLTKETKQNLYSGEVILPVTKQVMIAKISTLIFALLLVGVFGFFRYVEAIEYGGLGISPHISEVDSTNVLSRAWFIYTLDQGTLKHGKVDVVNTADFPTVVDLYPVDAVTTKDGAFAPEPRDKAVVGVGGWIKLSESQLNLAPKETRVINFTIRVPKDVEVGDHMGAIIVQGSAASTQTSGNGMRITTRVGARIYITIPGDIIKLLDFEEFTKEANERDVTFYAKFTNRGNVRIRVRGDIEIRNSSGDTVEVVALPEREVFPNKTIVVPIEWEPKDTTSGKLVAIATVHYGDEETLTKEVDLSLPRVKEPSKLLAIVSSGLGMGIGIGLGSALILILLMYVVLRKKGIIY